MSGYIWAATRLSKDFYYTIGSTVSGHDSKSSINLHFSFFLWSCSIFKTMALVWNMASVPSGSVKRSLSSSVLFSRRFLPLLFPQNLPFWAPPPTPPPQLLSLPHSERLVALIFFLTDRNNPLWQKHSGTDSSVHKMKLHARKMTLIFIQAKTETLHQDTTHTRTHARPCITLHLYARKPLSGLFI